MVARVGPRTIHLERDHGASPYQTPPDIRERSQHGRGGLPQGNYSQGTYFAGTRIEVQRGWSHQPFPILEEPFASQGGWREAPRRSPEAGPDR